MKTFLQFGRFIFVGGCGLLINIAVTFVLKEFFGIWYFTAFLVGILFNWTSIFLMNSLITFSGHSRQRYGAKYLTFLTMYLIAFAVGASVVYISTSILGVYYLLSIILASIITTPITFTFSRKFIFTYEQTSNTQK